MSIRLFGRKKGGTLAASSTFYFILTIVPLILVTIRGVGILVGKTDFIQIKLFEILSDFFPMATTDLLEKVKTIITAPLSTGNNTIINLFLLSITAVSFFNSVWNGLYLMTNDKSHTSFFKHLKGIVILLGTILLLVVMYIIPVILNFVFNLFQDVRIVNFILDYLPSLHDPMVYIFEFNFDSLMYSPIVKFIIFSTYFTYLYKWFFSWNISTKSAFFGAFFFIVSIFLSKNLFWIYFKYVRNGLIENYGDYYTFIVGLMWIFVSMALFFFGATICQVLGVKLKGDINNIGSKKSLPNL